MRQIIIQVKGLWVVAGVSICLLAGVESVECVMAGSSCGHVNRKVRAQCKGLNL